MLRFLAFCLLTVLFGSTEGHKSLACEGQTMTIDCGSSVINILRASYGRKQHGVCGNGGSTNCHAGKSWKVARDECQGLQNCNLKAWNRVFGDPCKGTKKYLEVSYECVSTAPEYLVRICEGNSQSIHCNSGKIDIINANYGRTAGVYICPGWTKNQNCGAPKSLDIVSKACQGKPSCSLSATNRQFGDPCKGTTKYLEVRYRC